MGQPGARPHLLNRARLGFDAFIGDVRYSARLLWRDRGTTIAAVLMLAAAIAVNGTMFTVVRAVLVRGFPQVAENDRLVYIQETRDGTRLFGVFPGDFTTWQAEAKTLQSVALVGAERNVTLSEADGPDSRELLFPVRVTWNLFRLTGVSPTIDRDFLASDDVPGAAPVAILSHDFWTRRFARDATIVGRTVRINRQPATIIGVMPEGFAFPNHYDLWMPLDRPVNDTDRSTMVHMAIGRLAPSVTLEEAQSELDLIAARIGEDHPDTNRGVRAPLESFSETFIGPDSTLIYGSMSIAVLFVLLIACANLANLTLTRTIGRSRELALRLALGAGRGRIASQLFAESLIVAAVSGAIAWWIIGHAVRIYAGATYSRYQVLDYSLDFGVGAYVVAVSLGTAVVLTLIAVIRVAAVDGHATLKDGARGIAGTAGGQRTSAVLVAVQMTLAVVLLCGAGLMARSFLKFQNAPIGVDRRDLLVGSFSLPAARYGTADAQAAFVNRLTARLHALPVVASHAIASHPPAGGALRLPFELEHRDVGDPRDAQPTTSALVIGSGYFSTLGTPVIAGREFADGDAASSTPVAIVNERFAARFWPGADPLQQRIRLVDPEGSPSWLTVVGVVGNVQQDDVVRQTMGPLVYVPFQQRPVPRLSFMARTRVPAATAANTVRQEVESLDAELIIGLYATVAYAVSRRTREIGVRMALGAETRAVHALVIGQALPSVAAGLVIGIAVSLAGARLLESQMIGISPFDPISFAMTAVILIATAAGGCLLPARRAARVDPAIALRHD